MNIDHAHFTVRGDLGKKIKKMNESPTGSPSQDAKIQDGKR